MGLGSFNVGATSSSNSKRSLLTLLLLSCLTMAACGGSSSGSDAAVSTPVDDTPVTPSEPRRFIIQPDNGTDRPAGTAQDEALSAFFSAIAGDTIEFAEGTFNFDTTLVMSHKKGITIRGAGLKE